MGPTRRQREAGTLSREVFECETCSRLRDPSHSEMTRATADDPLACLYHSGQIALLEEIEREVAEEEPAPEHTVALVDALKAEQKSLWDDLLVYLMAGGGRGAIPEEPRSWDAEIHTIACRLCRSSRLVGWLDETDVESAVVTTGWYRSVVAHASRSRYWPAHERARVLRREPTLLGLD